ncbi:MAG: HAMP domain-containing sensor histidine kinase [Peptococcaceae bacterium]|nr:HAMP domain-containing sensor histidine kinase [Peptococcaceae bacterium]
MKSAFKEPRLSVLFVGYLVVYGVSTFVLCVALLTGLILLGNTGTVQPANMQEIILSQNMSKIQQASPDDVAQYIPDGATYGIYDKDGKWLGGTMNKDRRSDAWNRYSLREYTPDDEGYYKYMPMENGDVCIVRYLLWMRYTSDTLNRILPPPEYLLVGGMLLVAVLNLLYLAHRFGRAINRRLETVQQVTEKIAANDLDFEVTQDTGIREINAVMASLGTLRDALKASLTTQWQKEQQKSEQLAALAHDIKTPLTVIRGNAELLQESAEDAFSRGSATYIVASAEDINTYLEKMRAVLSNEAVASCSAVQSVQDLVEILRHAAKQLTQAAQLPLHEQLDVSEGAICVHTEEALRAWNNLLSNAATYTDGTEGIACSYTVQENEEGRYLVATVRDYGAGFTAKDLQHADEAFYIGDESRHLRNHQGLGLAIAKAVMCAQGGMLCYANATEGAGATVSLWFKLENEQ